MLNVGCKVNKQEEVGKQIKDEKKEEKRLR